MPKKDLDSLMEKHYGKETELSEEEILAAKEQEEKERVEAEEAERIKKEEEEGKKKEEEEGKKKEEEEEEEEEIIFGEEEEEEEEDNKKKTTEDGEGEKSKPIDDKAFFEFASNKLGREITSYDDFVETKEIFDDNEQLIQIRKFVKDTKRDAIDWFRMQSIDIEGLTDEQLIKADMKLKYKNTLTDMQIDRKFKSEFRLDKEQFDSEDVEMAEIDLKVKAQEVRGSMQKLKDGYKIPVSEQQKQTEDTEAAIKQRLADKDSFVSRMKQEVDNIEYFNFDVDGQKVKYKIDKADLQKVKDKNQNLETFFDSFKDDKGVLDVEKLSLAMHFSNRENIAKLIKAVRGRYITQGEDNQIKKRKNTNLPGSDGQKSEASAEQKEVKSKFAQTVLAEMQGSKPRQRIKF